MTLVRSAVAATARATTGTARRQGSHPDRQGGPQRIAVSGGGSACAAARLDDAIERRRSHRCRHGHLLAVYREGEAGNRTTTASAASAPTERIAGRVAMPGRARQVIEESRAVDHLCPL